MTKRISTMITQNIQGIDKMYESPLPQTGRAEEGVWAMDIEIGEDYNEGYRAKDNDEIKKMSEKGRYKYNFKAVVDADDLKKFSSLFVSLLKWFYDKDFNGLYASD